MAGQFHHANDKPFFRRYRLRSRFHHGAMPHTPVLGQPVAINGIWRATHDGTLLKQLCSSSTCPDRRPEKRNSSEPK